MVMVAPLECVRLVVKVKLADVEVRRDVATCLGPNGVVVDEVHEAAGVAVQ